MRVYPAIDIKGGQCVRLLQGREEDATVYGNDPVSMANKWIEQGAEYLHVVDLDGAFSGQGKNPQAIQQICKAAGNIPVQLGGGIRNMEDLEERFSWGITRVILGTAAIENLSFVKQAAKDYPGRIVAGLDAKDGLIVTKGWTETSTITPIELGKRLIDMGIMVCVYTDISRDGMLCGPNFDATQRLRQETGMEVIASGGISSLKDIQKLDRMGIQGAIVGKVLYEGKVSLSRMIEIVNRKD